MGQAPEGRGLSEPDFSATPFPAGFGPDELLACYASGVFPMGEARDDPRIFLVEPDRRAVVPLDGLHISSRLARTIRQDRYAVTVDEDFAGTLDACAAATPGREDTWINAPIRALYLELHRRGRAHSVECRQDGRLVGGLYGVSLGGAFFGESMFSRERDASKIALTHLVARLNRGGWRLLDAQFMTPHLASLGAQEISQRTYRGRLRSALAERPDEAAFSQPLTGAQVLQSTTQAS